MSRAFVRENDDAPDELPERPISPHPNYVTPRGLALLDQTLAALEAEREDARSRGDTATLARIARDARYYTQRRGSARVVEPTEPVETVRFGVKVVLRLADGGERAFRLVGEDEADPAHGLISWVSPLASSLLGLASGDTCEFLGETAELARLEA